MPEEFTSIFPCQLTTMKILSSILCLMIFISCSAQEKEVSIQSIPFKPLWDKKPVSFNAGKNNITITAGRRRIFTVLSMAIITRIRRRSFCLRRIQTLYLQHVSSQTSKALMMAEQFWCTAMTAIGLSFFSK